MKRNIDQLLARPSTRRRPVRSARISDIPALHSKSIAY
jgi:hypothetical protein